MKIEQLISQKIAEALQSLYGFVVTYEAIKLDKTNPEFEGDYTLVVFPYLKVSKKKPEETAQEVGEFLRTHCPEVEAVNVVKGFLNIIIARKYWLSCLSEILAEKNYGIKAVNNDAPLVMVEYSSPNTNKPLHLGHVRNILLGYAMAEILKADGNKVMKVNLVNDRGVHICKSMLAWKKWGNGETPASSGMKGDKLVGKYYVEFDKHYKAEVKEGIARGMSEEEAGKASPLMLEVQEMLRKWEAGDADTLQLWKTMNSWVYKGFDETYNSLGVDFDKTYYESNTYLLGKKAIEEGLNKQVFKKRPDGSVFIDLTSDGLDEKTLLRADGTSVYMTQDLGTAMERFREFPALTKLVYTVGNEQDYHFKVLFLVLKKLGYAWAEGCYHLSYGMVELPDGKMKSREGTVVDADDLISEMIHTAAETTKELGKSDDLNDTEAEQLYHSIGMAALKYFILKVDPKKKMLFNPKESIDFNGHTGPFIQYTHARICSVMRKAGQMETDLKFNNIAPEKKELELIKLLYRFPAVIHEAAQKYSPAEIANYSYELAKEYNQFYHDHPILKEENPAVRNFRLTLSLKVGEVLKTALQLLGIEAPERM